MCGKLLSQTEEADFCEVTPIGLLDKPKEYCTGARWTGTCVAPRHVDASHCFFFVRISPVGGGCESYYFVRTLFSLSSRPRAGLAIV